MDKDPRNTNERLGGLLVWGLVLWILAEFLLRLAKG